MSPRPVRWALPFLVAVPVTLISACAPAVSSEKPVPLPAPTLDLPDNRAVATTILAGGCFWGVEGVFSHVRGVIRVDSGYHGGSAADAHYDAVTDGITNHAEAVRITYDPRIVSYGTLLRIFFSVVTNPTQLNRQGPDAGRQYRNAIVPANDSQQRVAEAYLAQLREGRFWEKPIVTRIETPRIFYRAEPEHLDFMERNQDDRYIRQWDAPKLANFRAMYPRLYQAAWAD
jgi:peptide-methionine (S)-S-oxide reductase